MISSDKQFLSTYLYRYVVKGTENGVKRTYGIAGAEGSSADVQGQMRTFGVQMAKAMETMRSERYRNC